MNLEVNEIYQLNIIEEWDLWYKENKKNINNNLVKFTDIKNFYKKLNFIPIYTDSYFVWLYRNNSLYGGNTVDFVKIELNGVLSFDSINLTSSEYSQLILNTMYSNVYKMKKMDKKTKSGLPKFIKTLRFYNHKVIQVQKGTLYSEWSLFKNNQDSINLIRTKLMKQSEEPIFIKTFFIPKKVIENVIEITCRSTEKEDKYVKHFGLLTKKQLLEYECGVPQDNFDSLKLVKTIYFEVNNILKEYFEYLKKNELEDNLKNANLFHDEIIKQSELPWKLVPEQWNALKVKNKR